MIRLQKIVQVWLFKNVTKCTSASCLIGLVSTSEWGWWPELKNSAGAAQARNLLSSPRLSQLSIITTWLASPMDRLLILHQLHNIICNATNIYIIACVANFYTLFYCCMYLMVMKHFRNLLLNFEYLFYFQEFLAETAALEVQMSVCMSVCHTCYNWTKALNFKVLKLKDFCRTS